MTEAELVQIEQRASRAAGSDWQSARDSLTESYGQHRYTVIARTEGKKLVFMLDGFAGSPEMGDTATFIAHARQDVPALVAEVRRLQEQNARFGLRIIELQNGIVAMGIPVDSPAAQPIARFLKP